MSAMRQYSFASAESSTDRLIDAVLRDHDRLVDISDRFRARKNYPMSFMALDLAFDLTTPRVKDSRVEAALHRVDLLARLRSDLFACLRPKNPWINPDLRRVLGISLRPGESYYHG